MQLEIEQIKSYLQNNTTVVFGYLFGSYANGTYIPYLNDLSLDNRLQISYEQRVDFELVKQHDILDYKEFKRMINAA